MADQKELEVISPLNAAKAGNSVDQAKMAMTPAAKQGVAGIENVSTNKGNVHNVATKSVWEVPTATTPEAKPPAQEGITDAERAKRTQLQRSVVQSERDRALEQLQASQSLKGLGSLGESLQRQLAGNLNNIFAGEEQKLIGDSMAAIAYSPELLKQMGGALSDTQKTAVQEAFTKIKDADFILDNPNEAANHADAQVSINTAISDIAKTLGRTDGKLAWEEVSSLFPDKNALLGTLASTALADTVTVDSALLTDMGYDTDSEKAELTSLLGLTGKETVTAFRQKVDGYLAKEYAEVTDLEAQLRDPTLSVEERTDVLNKLRDLGYTGSLASREEVSQTYKDIAAAEDQKFKFLGRELSLSEALSDSTVTGAVADYLSGDLKREDLPPVLADFVDANRKVFESAIEDLKDEVTDYNTMQDEWRNLVSLDLPPAIMTALGYNTNQAVQTTKLNPASMPLIQGIISGKDAQGNPVNAAKYKNVLTDIATKASPATMQTLLTKLKPADIDRLGSDAPLRNEYFNSLSAYENLQKTQALLDNADPNDDPTVADIMSNVYGFKDTDGNGSLKDMSEAVDAIQVLNSIGMTQFAPVLDSMMAVADLRDVKTLVKQLSTQLGSDVSNLDSFVQLRSKGQTKFMDAAGMAQEVKKFIPFANAVKTGDPGKIYAAASEAGVLSPSKSYKENMAVAGQLSRRNPSLYEPIMRGLLADMTKDSLPLLEAFGKGTDHYSGVEALGVQKVNETMTRLIEAMSPDGGRISDQDVTLVREAIQPYAKFFFDKRKPLMGNESKIVLSSLPKGYVPPVIPKSYKGMDKVIAVGGSPMPFYEGYAEFARMRGLPLNKNTADLFATFMAAAGL